MEPPPAPLQTSIVHRKGICPIPCSRGPLDQSFACAAQQLLPDRVDLPQHALAGLNEAHVVSRPSHPAVAVPQDHDLRDPLAQVWRRAVEDAVLEEKCIAGAQAEIDDPVRVDRTLRDRQRSAEPMRTRGEQREACPRLGKIGEAVADLHAGSEHPRVSHVLGDADVPMPRPCAAIGFVLGPLVDDRRGMQVYVGRQQLHHQGHGGGVSSGWNAGSSTMPGRRCTYVCPGSRSKSSISLSAAAVNAPVSAGRSAPETTR